MNKYLLLTPLVNIPLIATTNDLVFLKFQAIIYLFLLSIYMFCNNVYQNATEALKEYRKAVEDGQSN